MLRHLLFIMILITSVSFIIAEEDPVIFVTNNSDYYFKIGDQANIPVYITNSLGKQINGELTYTITETITQPGFQSTSSNTQSQPFPIESNFDSTPLGFSFGTSDKETTRTVSMSFTYTYEGVFEKVILPTINIHFVTDPNQQQQSQQEQQQSQTEEQHQPQTSNDEMQKNIQNNQKSQDSSALKNQINREGQEQQELDQKLNQEIQQNEQYNQAKKELEDMGFKQDTEPQMNSDQMNQEFTNPETGEKANLSADIREMKESLKNNETNNEGLDVKSDFQSQQLENKIMENQNNLNQEMKERIEELEKQGFNQTPMTFSNQNNQTTFEKTLMNPVNNETVTLSGKLNETDVLEFEEKNDADRNLMFFIIAIIALLIYFLYVKYIKKNKEGDSSIQPIISEPVDYRKDTLRMISMSKKLFEKNKKDAYELLSYAIRYYYRNEFGMDKEITNKELLKKLKNKKEFSEVKKILHTSSLIEFAKGKAKKEIFNESADSAESLVK